MGESAGAVDPHPTEGTIADAAVGVVEMPAPNGQAVWQRVRGRVEQQLSIVELQAYRLLDRPLDPAEVESASAAAAALARGLGNLQEHSLAQLARHIEGRLGHASLDATTGVHLAGAVEDLRTMLASAIAQLESAPTTAGTVLAIGKADAHFDAILWVLASRGHRIRHESTRLPDDGDEPAAIVGKIGTTLGPTMRTALQAAAETYLARVIVLHNDAPLTVQRELATMCATLLPLSSPPDSVSEEIFRQRAARDAHLGALICGAETAASVLEAHGFDCTLVRRPDDLLHVTANDGTAVVFGSSVPPKLALDMTRLLRASPTARRAPVVWLGTHDDVTRVKAEHLGIMLGEVLDDGVAVRIALQMRQAAADADASVAETGAVLSWPAARVLIDRSLVAAQRSGATTSLASITLGDAVEDSQIDQIAEALTREFRRSDVVGRRDGRHYVVALQGAARRVGVNRMSLLAPRLSTEGAGIEIGVAEFPSDGRDADELVAAADNAITRSRHGGGPSVVPTTWRPVGERAVDVLIVDPDPVLGEMLVSVLGNRGLRCDLLTDGRDALDRLTESATDALPRLLLLEVDVSGVDGLTLLRSLRPSGVLSHMDVLVVTARAAEADIRLALDLGVADVIRKPFSTTLLVHRASRLLDS
jgi:DNA-binding response OmpR family regulator